MLGWGLQVALVFSIAAPPKDAPRDWWSLVPISEREAPPASSAWARTPVDAFVFKKLEANGLNPAPEADRRTLIRRLTFDLHGLPPTPEEVDAFSGDSSARAYENLVDRLLASPRYGERWGRHWLDVVHYGESHGYDKDKRRPNAWPYRDYVIQALSSDKPYARFVEEQLAGDALFPGDPEGIVATGFIAAGPWDFVGHVELREGTTDKAIARSNDRDDMVAACMSTFASVTAHCARCHDHKFDPITQEDYYSLQAVFAGVDRADRTYDADAQTYRLRRELTAARAGLETKLKDLEASVARVSSPEIETLDAKIAEAEKRVASLEVFGRSKSESPSNGYHSAIFAERNATAWVEVDLGRVVPLDEIVLVPSRPVDFADTPGFGFPVRFQVVTSREPIQAGTSGDVVADRTRDDFANPGDVPLRLQAGGRGARYLRVTATRLWKRTDDFVLALAELQAYSGGQNVALGAKVSSQDSIEGGLWAKRFLVDGFSSRQALGAEAEWLSGVARLGEARTDLTRLANERKGLVDASLDLATRDALTATRIALNQSIQSLSALPAQRVVFAAASDFKPEGSFTPAKSPRPIHLLHRGDVKSPGPLVVPGALGCLKPLPARFEIDPAAPESARRAALAHWLTDRQNPLVWRSIVNRVWQYHFGRGLVDTPNDFGRMGSQPTHPELLDWLAKWFRDSGGSLKNLHRLLLTSSVYRQSSAQSEAAARIDSDNRWLWRMNRSRLEAEEVRDTLLTLSGKLDLTMGGPSVDHFFFKDDHSPTYDYTRFDVDDPASFRRSVYRFIVRSVPDPFMECLDCADPSILTPKRNNTLTALQALAMLNTPFVVRQAEHFAARLRALQISSDRQVEAAFRLGLGRLPTPEEHQLLVGHAAEHGLENTCRLIFNLNELLFID